MAKVIFAFILGVTVSACVAAQFPFHYYALDSDSYEGKLRGPTEADDLLLKMCKPTDIDKAPCMVMFTSAFLRMKENYLKCQIDLDVLQRQCNQ